MYCKKVLLVAVFGAASMVEIGTSVSADTVAITATVSGAPTPARTVHVYYNNTPTLGLPSVNGLNAYAGQINWKNAVDAGDLDTGTPGGLLADMPSTFAGGTFSSYCIDITQDISVNQVNVPFDGLTDNLASAPVIKSNSFNMGSTAATAIQHLYNNEYDAVTNAGTILGDPSKDDQSAAFQIAIWDIIYGTNTTHAAIDVTSTANRFYIGIASSSSIATMADAFVEQAYVGDLQGAAQLKILALTDENWQDQLVVGTVNSPSPPVVPEPSAALGGVSLLMGLSGSRRLRSVR